MPFEKLVETVSYFEDDPSITIGEMSKQTGEPSERIMDAIDAWRMLAGERTYISYE